MAETNINAFYIELSEAEIALTQASGRVNSLKQQIRDRGGVVPGEEDDDDSSVEEASDTPMEAEEESVVSEPQTGEAKEPELPAQLPEETNTPEEVEVGEEVPAQDFAEEEPETGTLPEHTV